MAKDDEKKPWVSLPRYNGRAWVFMHNLAAETILPARAARLSPTEARRYLFADLSEDIAGDIAPGDILVGGENFGQGPGGAAAVAALQVAGVTVALARSFGDDFARAALDCGIPALILDAPEGIRTGHTIRVDIDGGRVVDLSSGDRFPIRNLTDDFLDSLRERLSTD